MLNNNYSSTKYEQARSDNDAETSIFEIYSITESDIDKNFHTKGNTLVELGNFEC